MIDEDYKRLFGRFGAGTEALSGAAEQQADEDVIYECVIVVSYSLQIEDEKAVNFSTLEYITILAQKNPIK